MLLSKGVAVDAIDGIGVRASYEQSIVLSKADTRNKSIVVFLDITPMEKIGLITIRQVFAGNFLIELDFFVFVVINF